MSSQIHKLLSDKEIVEILERYLFKKIALEATLRLLKIKRRRFFDILKAYRENPTEFSVRYKRTQATHTIGKKQEEKIIKELKNEKKLIEDKRNPIRFYNYSYVKEQLENKYKLKVSLPTIIRRAKKLGIIRKSLQSARMIEKY